MGEGDAARGGEATHWGGGNCDFFLFFNMMLHKKTTNKKY